MVVLNFSHPLTDAQCGQIERLAGQSIADLRSVPTQFDEQQPFVPQIDVLVNQVGLTAEQWQTASILVVLPSLNFIAAALLANLHGRMGYFPSVVRTRAVAESLPRRYEVAELLDLQTARDRARRVRQ